MGLPPPASVVGYLPAHDRQRWLDSSGYSYLGDFFTARTLRSVRGPLTNPSPAFSRHTARPHNREAADAAHILRHIVPLCNDHQLTPDPSEPMDFPTPRIEIQPDPALNKEDPVEQERKERTLDNLNTTSQMVLDGPQALRHHHRADRVTVKWSEEHRIRIGQDHRQLFSSERARLKQLKKGLGKFVDVPSLNEESWSLQLFEECARKAYAPWVSKRTKKEMQRSADRAFLDSPLTFAHLFLKSQYDKKEPNRFKDARPGQVVSEFNKLRNFRDAPFALYFRRQLIKHKFPTTYLHTGLSPAGMDRWYSIHWTPGERMTACDYTAWDKGCDRVFLAFGCWALALTGIPDEYIQKWADEQVNVYSHLGPHMLKVESGFQWTWDINTLYDMALTGATLDCPPRTPACFSGDDSLVLGHWGKSRGFEPSKWSMHPKPEYGRKLTFCGYEFGLERLFVSATVVLHRTQYGLALGRNDPTFWLSIRQSISEAARASSFFSPVISTAAHNLATACILYGF